MGTGGDQAVLLSLMDNLRSTAFTEKQQTTGEPKVLQFWLRGRARHRHCTTWQALRLTVYSCLAYMVMEYRLEPDPWRPRERLVGDAF